MAQMEMLPFKKKKKDRCITRGENPALITQHDVMESLTFAAEFCQNL